MIEIQIDARDIADWPQSLQDALGIGMEESLDYLLDRLGNYSYMNISAGRPTMQFVSARQRRGFFAALRAGRITVPYRRTGNLGRMWSRKVERGANDLTGTLGSNARSRDGNAYGPYVIGSGTQAAYHQGRWRTDEQVSDDSENAIRQIFERALGRMGD